MNSGKKRIYRVDIPVQLDIEQAVKRLPPRTASRRTEGLIRELADEVCKIARPRAVYQLSRSRVVDNTTVEIDGIVFTSKILSRLLENQDMVVPFIATIGKELDDMAVPSRDMMRSFCLDAVKTVVLVSGVDYLTEYIKEKHGIPRAALMNPGELEDWPITEQKPLFALFGGAEKRIGVSLTAGGAMKPIKSRSGIVFPSDTGFISCRLCTQLTCPGRQAEYDPEMVKEYLG